MSTAPESPTAPLHIPALRWGQPYESLDTAPVRSHRSGETLAVISQVPGGMVRRDMKSMAAARAVLRGIPIAERLEICKRAAELLLSADLPLTADPAGPRQGPDDYLGMLADLSGLPRTLGRRNLEKIAKVLRELESILAGLTRGLDLSILDVGLGRHSGVPVSYFCTTDALGVVLPSNSPGVNSIWLPALALGVPVVLKPGRDEPLTPWRIIQALIAAGCPPKAFCFLPTDHDGADTILTTCGRGIIFGDDNTTDRYASNPAIERHGTGRSKVLIGDDCIDDWPRYLDVLVASVAANGGRSCINASTIVVSRHADALADALAQRLAQISPAALDDPAAHLSAFANAAFAGRIHEQIEHALAAGGAVDVTARHRHGPRLVVHQSSTYLQPTLVRCESLTHPLGNTEYLFAYAAVVEVPQAQMLSQIGPSLVVTAITEDPAWTRELLDCRDIQRLNLGPWPTSHVEWDQPHEGNLFEFLYHRRAIQK